MRRCSAPRSEGQERDLNQAKRQRLGFAPAELLRHRVPGETEYLERALDSLRIARLQPHRRLWIDARQLGVERRPAPISGLRFDGRPDPVIGLRQRREPFAQRLEVEHGPADEQRHAAARGDLAHEPQRIGAELRRRVAFGRVDDVDQVVRHAAPLGPARLGGADIHAAEYLRRIDADDLDREIPRQLERDRALAARGRPHQKDCRRLHWPRRNSLSRSARLIWNQVGRP